MPKRRLACAAQRRVGALGMGDAAARGHPVDVARDDRLVRAEAVAVQDLALEQVGHGGEADVRVRPHVEPLPGQELARPHLVEEDEGPDHLPLLRGQGAADLEAAEVVGAGQEHQFQAARRRGAGGIFGRLPAHPRSSESPGPQPRIGYPSRPEPGLGGVWHHPNHAGEKSGVQCRPHPR